MPSSRLINMTAEQELQFLIGWATQTLAFCIALRLQETGESTRPAIGELPDHAEASALAIELWRDALAERGPCHELEGAGAVYIRNVFNWCDNHRNR